MKKDFLGDILSEGDEPVAPPEPDDSSDALYIGSQEEQFTTTVQPEAGKESFIGKKKPAPARIEMTPPSPQAEKSPSGMVYVQARRVAEMKFKFFKLVAFLVPVNILFAFLAWYQVNPAGKFWFVWPLVVSAAVVTYQYLKAFLLKGRNLQGVIERAVHRMAMRESERIKYREF